MGKLRAKLEIKSELKKKTAETFWNLTARW